MTRTASTRAASDLHPPTMLIPSGSPPRCRQTRQQTQGVAGAAGGFVKFARHEWLPVDLYVENKALRREVDELRQEEEYLRTQLRLARREAKSMVRAKTLSDISDMVRKEREGATGQMICCRQPSPKLRTMRGQRK